MGYSEDALIFAQIPVAHQVRLEDRVSFLYLEYCRVIQDSTGVVALREYDDVVEARKLSLPVGSLAVLALGPGTSVTQPALTSCSRAGCTVVVTGSHGLIYYTHATPLSTSSRWAIAQAKVIANETNRRKAARFLYARQLDIDMDENLTLAQMRGVEGRMIRKAYQMAGRKYSIKDFRRDVGADNAVNQCLNLLNGILYGAAATVCSSIGINPALGIIHSGDQRSFLFDLADLYKPTITIPLAFEATTQKNPLAYSRQQLRKKMHHESMLADMLETVQSLFSPYLPTVDEDQLVADRGPGVPGHTQYGDK